MSRVTLESEDRRDHVLVTISGPTRKTVETAVARFLAEWRMLEPKLIEKPEASCGVWTATVKRDRLNV